ncbi:GGDEF domain-containing protein [Thalassotalea euphylliae]|uniref:diguanylate cyclase n=1 Tax=Thalassotalea euphylliae TaxID=1655234 RepID=A0A3E0TMJ5_9GAMM|nr:GGDEF domain-containing protein [Thalassotalea euphylliae]REL25774.1 GGDEF domain-containing protein [Thalassotalea euphylliae]
MPHFIRKLIISCLLLLGSAVSHAKTLNYCVDPNWAPYEYLEEGQHAGISAFYFEKIAKLAGLQIALKPTVNWQETMDALAAGECDITPLLNFSDSRAEYLTFSVPYFQGPNVIFAHYQQKLIGGLAQVTNERIGVVKSYRLESYLNKFYPNVAQVSVNSELEGLKKVNNKEIDLFVSSYYGANFLIHQHNLANIRIIGLADLKDQLRIGVRHEHRDIMPRINQAILKLSEEDHRHAFSLLEPVKVISQINYTLAWQIGAIGALLSMMMGLRYYYSLQQKQALANKNAALECLHAVLENKNKQLEQLAVTDHLTQLHNRGYLTEKVVECINRKKRYQSECCLILCNVDNFKVFNDTYGHQVGDEVLVTLANTIRSCARETDYTARWGGEEFVIICPETNLNEGLSLANRIRQQLAKESRSMPSPITCSIGIAQLGSKDTQETWFGSADRALYFAKEAGKDKIEVAIN